MKENIRDLLSLPFLVLGLGFILIASKIMSPRMFEALIIQMIETYEVEKDK